MLHTVRTVTSPQQPWQQGGYQPAPQRGYPPPGTPAGGFPPPGGLYAYPQGAGQASPYAAPPVPRPRTVEIAFWIAVVAPMLVTVMMVLDFLAVWKLIQQLPSEHQIQSIFGALTIVVLVVVTVFYLLLSGLWIMFGFQLRAGRNWARVVLTVLAGFWLISAVSGLVNGGYLAQIPADKLPASALALGYAQNVVSVLATISFVVLVFLTPSNQYFETANRRY